MSTSSSQVTGKLIPVNTYANETCIPETVQLLIKLLVDSLAVQIPGNPGDTFVIVSNQAPTASDRQKLWLAVDLAGTPVALRKFVDARWVDIAGFGLPWVQEFLGNPTSPLPGWQPLNGSNGTVDTSGTWRAYGSLTMYKAIFVG